MSQMITHSSDTEDVATEIRGLPIVVAVVVVRIASHDGRRFYGEVPVFFFVNM